MCLGAEPEATEGGNVEGGTVEGGTVEGGESGTAVAKKKKKKKKNKGKWTLCQLYHNYADLYASNVSSCLFAANWWLLLIVCCLSHKKRPECSFLQESTKIGTYDLW